MQSRHRPGAWSKVRRSAVCSVICRLQALTAAYFLWCAAFGVSHNHDHAHGHGRAHSSEHKTDAASAADSDASKPEPAPEAAAQQDGMDTAMSEAKIMSAAEALAFVG